MAEIQTQLPVSITDGVNKANITGGGALQVDASAVTQPVSVVNTVSAVQGETSTGVVCYNATVANVAKSATGVVTYTVSAGKTFYLKQIVATSSGAPCKVVIDYGLTPTVVCVGYYSATSPYFMIKCAQPIPIPAATPVNVRITNNAGVAQDVSASIMGREV